MPRRHRLALALFLCGAAPLAHASAYRSVCPADPGQAPTGELTATRVAAARTLQWESPRGPVTSWDAPDAVASALGAARCR